VQNVQQLSGYQQPHSARQESHSQQINTAASQPYSTDKEQGEYNSAQQFNTSSSAAASQYTENPSNPHNKSGAHANSSAGNSSPFPDSNRTSCPKHKRVWCQCRRGAADQGSQEDIGPHTE
jgi:hypothetical protein